MRRAIVWGLFVSSCVMFLPPGARAQKATTEFDKNYDFSAHKKYKWRENRLMTRQNPDTNQVLDIKIVKAVNKNLAAKGYEEVADKPDFYIYYDGGGNSDFAAGGATRAGDGPTTSADVAPGYGLGNGPTLSPRQWLTVDGQIEFYIVSAATQKPVWESTYKKTFRDPNKALKNMDKEVDTLVEKVFNDFPPKKK
jgi:Domain of unknown function (DUF4136)